jgi:hypothetical protein
VLLALLLLLLLLARVKWKVQAPLWLHPPGWHTSPQQWRRKSARE